MSAGAAWKSNDHVVFTELEDGIVLLDTRTNIYYSLDGIGPFLWRRLREGWDTAGLASSVTERYDVDAATARADIAEWIDKMAGAGLIELVEEHC